MKILSILLGCCLVASSYAANISVVPLIMSLTTAKRFGDISVYNPGKKKAYVKTTLFRIDRPGMKTHKKVKLNYDSPLKFGLLVSPSKLVLGPGVSQRIRVLSVVPPGKVDKVYQVEVVPVEGQWYPVKGGHNKNFHGMVDLITGYLVTVILRPAHPMPHVTLTRHGKQLTIKNDGNTYVRIYQAQYCPSSGKCQAADGLANYTLFAGNTHSVALSKAEPVRYRMILPNSTSKWVTSA